VTGKPQPEKPALENNGIPRFQTMRFRFSQEPHKKHPGKKNQHPPAQDKRTVSKEKRGQYRRKHPQDTYKNRKNNQEQGEKVSNGP